MLGVVNATGVGGGMLWPLFTAALFAGSIAAADTDTVMGEDSDCPMSYMHIRDSDKRSLASEGVNLRRKLPGCCQPGALSLQTPDRL